MTRTTIPATLLATALGLGAATGVTAQGVVDTDGDGAYSLEEMTAAYPDMTEATFMTLDTDGSGTIDEAELTAGQEAGLIPAG